MNMEEFMYEILDLTLDEDLDDEMFEDLDYSVRAVIYQMGWQYSIRMVYE